MREENGSITLETALVLPIFFFLFMFIYGLFAVINTQNRMTHALVQSSKSLSLDSYRAEKVESANEKGTKFWSSFGDMVQDIYTLNDNEYFTPGSGYLDWYEDNGSGAVTDNSVIKNRFMAYLAGDKDKAIQSVKNMKIVNGMDGIQFTSKVERDNLTITIKYEIQYWFDFFDMGKIPMEQTITTRMWK